MFIELTHSKTYASIENAKRAVEKKIHPDVLNKVTWFIQRTEDNRFFPVFVGERAAANMIHFHFNIVT